MRTPRLGFMIGALCLVLLATGCGPSKTEREARERARIEAEEAAGREAAIANKAITGMNQKLGRKPPDLDLGLAPEKKTEPTSPAVRKP